MASALPYILVLLVLISGGRLADYLRRHFLSTGTVRKIFNTLGKVQEGYGIAWGKSFPCLKQHEKAHVSWSISHTHAHLSGRSEIFGGFKKICLRCIYFHATVSSSLPPRCSSLTPTSDQCKRAPPKNISSPIWKSEGIRLGWVLKRFLSFAFLSASPASVCPKS